MKKLLVLLFSLFFLFSHSVFADDISDFVIEGISIGDSLLDYMTEDEILKEIERNKSGYSNLKGLIPCIEFTIEIESNSLMYNPNKEIRDRVFRYF